MMAMILMVSFVPFFDASEAQVDGNDGEFNEEEHLLVRICEETMQTETEVHLITNLPNSQLKNVNQLKDELRKQNLPVNGRKDILIQCLISHLNVAVIAAQREKNHVPYQWICCKYKMD
jgi:hypothetical protein